MFAWKCRGFRFIGRRLNRMFGWPWKNMYERKSVQIEIGSFHRSTHKNRFNSCIFSVSHKVSHLIIFKVLPFPSHIATRKDARIECFILPFSLTFSIWIQPAGFQQSFYSNRKSYLSVYSLFYAQFFNVMNCKMGAFKHWTFFSRNKKLKKLHYDGNNSSWNGINKKPNLWISNFLDWIALPWFPSEIQIKSRQV